MRLRGALLQRDAALVLRQPLIEGLQRWIQRPGKLGIACSAEVFFEVAFELKHVAQIVGAGKSEAAIDIGRHTVIADFLAQGLAESGSHLRTGQMLSRDAYRLADELASFSEDAVRALANIFGGDAGQFLLSHG